MFVSNNVPALFKKGTLKLTQNDEGEWRRVAEATCVIEPFPAALAHELGEDIAAHLFDDAGVIREELDGIDLRVRVGLQGVTVRQHEDLEPCALINPASIKDVSVVRVEDKKLGRQWLSLSFVLVFSLEEKAARNFVLDEFGKTLLWSFRGLQADLLRDARLHEVVARLSDAGPATLTGPDGTSVDFNEETATAHRAAAKRARKQADAATKH